MAGVTLTINGATVAADGTFTITPAMIGAATSAQGAKADNAIQPNTTPTLSGLSLTGNIAPSNPGGAALGTSALPFSGGYSVSWTCTTDQTVTAPGSTQFATKGYNDAQYAPLSVYGATGVVKSPTYAINYYFGPTNTYRISYQSDGNTVFYNGSTAFTAINATNCQFGQSGYVSFACLIRPNADNAYTLGATGYRWSTVYAYTGTISTSDAREKTTVTPLSDSEIAAAKALASEIGTYKWLSAVTSKGADARNHIGMTVQRAIEIMTENSLDAMSYGFICYDTWDAVEAVTETAADGTVTIITPAQEAGDRYSFRMDELGMFIARGQQQALQEQADQLAALVARVAALEAK